MQVAAVGPDALKDIIERVTLGGQGLLGHASLNLPKGLRFVHFTFCPLHGGPPGSPGPQGKGWVPTARTKADGGRQGVDGRRLCVCEGDKCESLQIGSGWHAVRSASHSDRTSVAWDAQRCLGEPGAGVAHRRLHWSEDPCA